MTALVQLFLPPQVGRLCLVKSFWNKQNPIKVKIKTVHVFHV